VGRAFFCTLRGTSSSVGSRLFVPCGYCTTGTAMPKTSSIHSSPQPKGKVWKRRLHSFRRRSWRLLKQSVQAIWTFLKWFGLRFQKTNNWVFCQLVGPTACFGCVYAGVVLTVLLPSALWLSFAGPLLGNGPSAVMQSLTGFPVVDIPSADVLEKAMYAALPIAVRVYAARAYRKWAAADEPLVARLLYACHEGVIWPGAWWWKK
jgi:hypothetical protein